MVFDSFRSAGGRLTGRVRDYGTLVMFPHTVFSLSFAVISMVLAADGLPAAGKVVWILLAFLGARTGANAINRVIDAEIDALNPRTSARQIPRKLLGKPEVILFSLICFAVMFVAAAMLNPLCLLLSPAALLLMVFYSYTKRFTWLCHLILGIATACAPVGAWLAVTGTISWVPLMMGAANTLWVAGFDIIYGSQDVDFDTKNRLHSIPVRFGVGNALGISAAFHAATVVLLAAVGFFCPRLGVIYQVGMLIIAVLFIVEHLMVSPEKLGNVKIASYSINQLVSVVFLVAGLLDVFV